MNLQRANLEDLLAQYYWNSPAHTAAVVLGSWVRDGKDSVLATVLRDYRAAPITSYKEIELRAATDRLLTLCSVLEISSIARFVLDLRAPELQTSELRATLQPILENRHVRRYYEDFYPTRLPRLFRWRLAGAHDSAESLRNGESAVMLSFLSLDHRFLDELEDRVFLRMLDSFLIDGVGFRDLVSLIGSPQDFIDHLLAAPEERDVLSEATSQFSTFMEFCFDLRKLLAQTESAPLLQSAIWSHYGYWFDILGDELNEELGHALSAFLMWQSREGDERAAESIHAYVKGAIAVLKDLTWRGFAEPLDRVLEGLPP